MDVGNYGGTVGWAFLVVICPREVVNVVPATNANHHWYLDISGPTLAFWLDSVSRRGFGWRNPAWTYVTMMGRLVERP